MNNMFQERNVIISDDMVISNILKMKTYVNNNHSIEGNYEMDLENEK